MELFYNPLYKDMGIEIYDNYLYDNPNYLKCFEIIGKLSEETLLLEDEYVCVDDMNV